MLEPIHTRHFTEGIIQGLILKGRRIEPTPNSIPIPMILTKLGHNHTLGLRYSKD